jgi:hypothetical protein
MLRMQDSVVPVQVNGRIVDGVSLCMAQRMAGATNVTAVRRRHDKQIVRLIVVPHAIEDKDPTERPSDNSRKPFFRENVFRGSDPVVIRGYHYVFTLKHSAAWQDYFGPQLVEPEPIFPGSN